MGAPRRRCDQRRCLRRVRELGTARARREALRRALGRLGAVAARARWQRVYGARWQRVYEVAPLAAVRAALGRAMQRWRRYWAWRWALAAARRKGNAGAVRKAFAAVHGNASEMVIGSRRRSGGARELVLVSAKRSAVEHARTRRHCREAIRRWAAGGAAVEAAAAVAAEAARLPRCGGGAPSAAACGSGWRARGGCARSGGSGASAGSCASAGRCTR